MKVALVNPVWDARATTPAATIDRFHSLTGWADALVGAGATDVRVFQRFHDAAEVDRHGVRYSFVADGRSPMPPAWYRGAALSSAVARIDPDVVHVNGLDHPALTGRLRRSLPRCGIVVQDHGGFDPARLSPWRRRWMRRGLASADALLVAAPQLAPLFVESGTAPARMRIRDVMEASTTLRAPARARPAGELSILFVGRLNANKDPLVVLAGFRRFLGSCQEATLTFVYEDAGLEPELRAAIGGDPVLARRVSLVGRVRYEEMAAVYARADLFVIGSHHEGSGYAAIEAMACGVVPVLTDIPSFRWLTDEGRAGALWNVGDAASLCDALVSVAGANLEAQRAAVRTRFDHCLSWEAIGRRALQIYGECSRT